MKTKSTLHSAALAALAIAGMHTIQAATITWPIQILPPGSCTVTWSTDSPVASGNFTKSGRLSFNERANIQMRFVSTPGYQMDHVFKNTEDQLPWIKQNGGRTSFGPVTKAHTIVVVSSLINPTGNFTGNYTDGKNLTSIVDVTGNYNGTETVQGTSRAYNVDVAMDDSGKVQAMGSITGIKDKSGKTELKSGSVGSVKTVANTPNANLKGRFQGQLDDKPVQASGSASGDLVMQTNAGKSELEGKVAGTSTYNGTKKSAAPQELILEVPPDKVDKIQKAWGMTMSFQEKTVKGKKVVEATGELRLPNGEYRRFTARKAPYNAKTGYSVVFNRGVKLDTAKNPVYVKNPKTGLNKLDRKGNPIPVVDTKSTVKVSKMKLVQTSGLWTATEGQMTYSFMGQKGKGAIAEFLD
jgi:hypothetical protein